MKYVSIALVGVACGFLIWACFFSSDKKNDILIGMLMMIIAQLHIHWEASVSLEDIVMRVCRVALGLPFTRKDSNDV